MHGDTHWAEFSVAWMFSDYLQYTDVGIRRSDASSYNRTLCKGIEFVIPFPKITLHCQPGVVARYVQFQGIRNRGRWDRIWMCEVEVVGFLYTGMCILLVLRLYKIYGDLPFSFKIFEHGFYFFRSYQCLAYWDICKILFKKCSEYLVQCNNIKLVLAPPPLGID